MDFYVYLHRKATTGEIFYVGKGQGNRAWSHKSRSKYWQNLVAKHGYTIELAGSGLQEWYAFELEKELVALYGRKDTGDGALANLSDGGDGPAGRVVSDSQRAHHSKTIKANWADPIKKAKYLANPAHQKDKFGTPVCCVELNKIFVSQKSAARYMTDLGVKCSPRHINECANGKGRVKAGGYTWVIPGKAPKEKQLYKTAVVRVKDNLIFASQRNALQWVTQQNLRQSKGLNSGLLNACLKGSKRLAYGSPWRYATSEEAAALKEKGASWAPLSDPSSVA